MMRKVKYTLAFLTGAGYVSAWWCVAIMDPASGWIAIPALIAFIGGLAIATVVVIAFAEHWKED